MSAHECVDPELHDAATRIRIELLRESANSYAPGVTMIEKVLLKFQRAQAETLKRSTSAHRRSP